MSEAAEAFTYDPGKSENMTFTEADLNGAVLSVNSKKMSIQDAANTFQVPILTLWNKVLNIKMEENEEEILTKQEEVKIARILRETTDYGCHPSVEDLLYTVKSVLEEKGQFSTLKDKLGKDWILGFLERHRGITLKPSENMKNLPGEYAQSRSSTKSSRMVLLDDKNVFIDCSIKKERPDEGSDVRSSPEEALQKALEEVKLHGMNVFAAAKLHNVSPATLWDEVSGKDTTSMSKQGNNSTTLNAEEEAEIADMLRKAIAKGLEVTRNDLRETVKAVLDSKGRITRFVNNKPSKWWVPSFLSRHPGINLKEFSCRPTSTKRASDTAQVSGSEPAVTVSDCILSSSSPAADSNQPLSDKLSSKSSTASSDTLSHDVVSNVSSANTNLQDRQYCTPHMSSAHALTSAKEHAMNSSFPTGSTSVSCGSQVSECSTLSSSTSVISNSMIKMSTTMSHTHALTAHSVLNGAAVNGPKIPVLMEIRTSHATTGPLLSAATQDNGQNRGIIDSTLSLLKRFTMINFSLEKNYDDDIMAQQRDIEKEVAQTQPLITEMLTFDDIVEEYAKEDAVYRQKLQDLKSKYKGVRKTRGDGNCFFRAFGFAYLEKLLSDTEEYKRFYEIALNSKDILLKLNFPPFTLEDFHEVFMDIINQVEDPGNASKLLATFNDQGQSDYFVVYLRLLVSGHLQAHDEDFLPFIDGERSVKDFCAQEVEPMGRESDHIHIVALTRSLKAPITVEYMDRAGATCNAHHFTGSDKEGTSAAESLLTLLYRPGHYDIIYPL